MGDYHYQGESFLNRLYQDLHMSDSVMHTATSKDDKNEKVRKYLDRLNRVENLARSRDLHGIQLLKELYYQKYIIKEENIKESFYDKKKLMALDRGYGHIEFTEEEKKDLVSAVIGDQKKSLDVWLDYFFSEECPYPEWFKYYAFQGMLKLGTYDHEKSQFNKRSTSTTNLFVHLDKEALELVYQNLQDELHGEPVEEPVLQRLLENGSFSKLYGYMLRKVELSRKDMNEGIWIKYDQGSDPNILVKGIEGSGTNWCTAGIETAKGELQKGDFYVYYTKDSEGLYKNPRIAIWMNGKNKIEEIRGIAPRQEIEPEMQPALEEKLKEFPDGKRYKKKVSDMKKLTSIYTKVQTSELTLDEIRFLYQIDNKIEGFGYGSDPRISEILKTRDYKQDLVEIFHCREDEISSDISDVLNGKQVKYFYGHLDLSFLQTLEGIYLPRFIIGGGLNLSGLSHLEKVEFPEYIYGNLNLENVTNIKDVQFPKTVLGSVRLNSLERVPKDGFKLPETVKGDLWLSHLKCVKGIELPSSLGGDLGLNGLQDIEGLELPDEIFGELWLNGLKSAHGLKLPTILHGNLWMNGLESANELALPKFLGGGLGLKSLKYAGGLQLPKQLNGTLDLSSLVSTDDLILPESLEGDLILKSLTYIENFKFPEHISGDLNLENLITAKNQKFPSYLGGSLGLESVTHLENVEFPDFIGRDCSLDGMIHASSFQLSPWIGGDVFLGNLLSAENLGLSKFIGGTLYLTNLESSDGLVVPKDFQYAYLESLYLTIEDLYQKSSIPSLTSVPKNHGVSILGILFLLNFLFFIGFLMVKIVFRW